MWNQFRGGGGREGSASANKSQNWVLGEKKPLERPMPEGGEGGGKRVVLITVKKSPNEI